MIGGKIADGGGGIASLVVQPEEDADARLDWAVCSRLRTEVVDSLTTDRILLIIKGGNNLGGLAEILDRSVPGKAGVPNKEHGVHEGPELDHLEVAGALLVFAGPEAEVEANGD